MAKIALNRWARTAVAAALLTMAGAVSALEYRYIQLTGPGRPAANGWSSALDVNARGQVVGSVSWGGIDDEKGYIYDHGRYTLLGGPTGAELVQARAISDDGTVVGSYRGAGGQWHSFLYSKGRYKTFELPDLPGVSLSSISPNGRYLSGTGAVDAFVYDRLTSRLTLVPTDLDFNLSAEGVNNRGVMVGSDYTWMDDNGQQQSAPYSFNAGTGALTVHESLAWTPFHDINGNGAVIANGVGDETGDIGTMIGRPGQLQQVALHPSASFGTLGMNDSRWLVGNYVPDGGATRMYGFLAMPAALPVPEPMPAALSLAAPVPEPGSWALLAGGLVVVGWRVRRRA